MTAATPSKTKPAISDRGMKTYQAIADRLAALQPPIALEQHIAQTRQPGQAALSTLEAHESTLDGIVFKANDPKVLAQAFRDARDKWGEPVLTSLQEEPDHWGLKLSFKATPGTGFREVWRAAPYYPSAAVPAEPGKADELFRMRFGTAGNPIRFTSLHGAVDEIGGTCRIHIDESGFVLALPKGVALTPDLYDHFVNELLWKTKFRDWLSGKMPNDTARRIVEEVIRRVSLTYPNASNGYAGLSRRINSMRRPQVPGDVLLTTLRFALPVGVTADVYENDHFKVQVTGSMAGGDSSITLSLGGVW